ncbi:MAG: phage integrase SAM-like domain-containing protein, partial [Paludibacter sp.]|nr:phage integrase SAM-like domain-containing protein [Paludibacter sp.]
MYIVISTSTARGKCRFCDLTVDFCKGFRYLLSAKRQRNNGKGRNIAHNSAAGYWSIFRALLKMAYQEKYLRENVNDFLEKIEWKEVK